MKKRLAKRIFRALVGPCLLIGCGLFCFFLEPSCLPRLWLSLLAFGSRFTGEPLRMLPLLPLMGSGSDFSFGNFGSSIKWFFLCFGQRYLWAQGLSFYLDVIYKATLVAMMAAVLLLVLWLLVSGEMSENGKPASESTRLSRGFDSLVYRRWPSFLEGIRLEASLFRGSVWFWPCLSVLFLSLGGFSYAIDFLGCYIGFFFRADLLSFPDFLLSLLGTLWHSLTVFPWPFWLLGFYAFLCWFRKAAAKRSLQRMERCDRSAVESDTGLFTLVLGKMRGGKTTLAESIARESQAIFRDNAFENMSRVMAYFPEFPWIELERCVARLSLWPRHRIVNIQQAGALASRLWERYPSKGPKCLFGYDCGKSRVAYYDGSVNMGLGEAMAIYAESYFVYFYPSSLIVGNLSIRQDAIRIDRGHLVLWDHDSLNRDNSAGWDPSFYGTPLYSHVIDYNVLRFGRKVGKEDPFNGQAGPMVAISTEFGKEYGNQISNAGVKATDEGSNSKNDMLDMQLKLGGHLANVWHTNFFKMIADEQRSGSLSSNLVDIAQTVFVADPKLRKRGVAYRMWSLESLIYEKLYGFCDSLFVRYRSYRDDRCFLFSLIAWMRSACYFRLVSKENRYGYYEYRFPMMSSDSAGNMVEEGSTRYFIFDYVDYADRFESACMKDFLNAGKLGADVGVFDLPVYSGLMPTRGEWLWQRSHLVEDLSDPSSSSRFAGRKGPSRAGSRTGRSVPARGGRASGRGER